MLYSNHMNDDGGFKNIHPNASLLCKFETEGFIQHLTLHSNNTSQWLWVQRRRYILWSWLLFKTKISTKQPKRIHTTMNAATLIYQPGFEHCVVCSDTCTAPSLCTFYSITSSLFSFCILSRDRETHLHVFTINRPKTILYQLHDVPRSLITTFRL